MRVSIQWGATPHIRLSAYVHASNASNDASSVASGAFTVDIGTSPFYLVIFEFCLKLLLRNPNDKLRCNIPDILAAQDLPPKCKTLTHR